MAIPIGSKSSSARISTLQRSPADKAASAHSAAKAALHTDRFERRRVLSDPGHRLFGIPRQPLTPTEPQPTNPKLAAFLGEHPDLRTNQDFIQHFWSQGGWNALVKGCDELEVDINDVTNYRSGNINDLAYPPTPPDGSLPRSAAEADPFHISQFTDPTYNATGPSSSTNCGPASLAMVLDTQGQMPPGLTPEQKVDHARALMYPDDPRITEIEVRGQMVTQLDADHELSGTPGIIAGAEGAGLGAEERSGWAELDQALANGEAVVAYGDCYRDWKDQFPAGKGRYGSGEIGHFISVLGRTDDGKYIVSDPMFTGGPVEMTREQLAVFFDKDGDNTPGFVAVQGAAGAAPAQDPARDAPVLRLFKGVHRAI